MQQEILHLHNHINKNCGYYVLHLWGINLCVQYLGNLVADYILAIYIFCVLCMTLC